MIFCRITDADYADDLVLFANILAEAKYLLHSLEQVARDIGLYVNSDKTEFVCINNRWCHLIFKPLKLVNQFIHFGSNISSTESDVKTQIKHGLLLTGKQPYPPYRLAVLLYGYTIWTWYHGLYFTELKKKTKSQIIVHL